jgi:hypothetical protein
MAVADKKASKRTASRSVPVQDLLGQETVTMTVLAQDPDVVSKDRPVTTGLAVPASRLQRGPRNHRFHVVDVNASGTTARPPVVLHEPDDPWTYADPWADLSDAKARALASDAGFRAQNVFAIAAHTLALFERYLGRRIPWRSGWPHLYLVPTGMLGANAHYSPDMNAVVFGWLPAVGDLPVVYSCMAYDVIAHEVTHAVLDGLRPRFVEPGLPDQLAFHEGLADLVAMLSVFDVPGVAQELLDSEGTGKVRIPGDAEAGHDATPAGRAARIRRRVAFVSENALTGLAEQLGTAQARREGDPDADKETMPLRRSIKLPPSPAYLDQDEYAEPHRRAEILVAAVMQAMAGMWAARLEALDDRDGLDAARMAEEGQRAAEHLLGMLLRAIDYLPPVELEFPNVLDAILCGDARVSPDDSYHYRDVLQDSFEAFGIHLPDHQILDEDGTAAPTPAEKERGGLELVEQSPDPDAPAQAGIHYEHLNFASLRTSAEEVFGFMWNNASALGLDLRLATRVDRVHTTTRVGPDGLVLNEVLADYTQWIRTTAGELLPGMTKPEGMDAKARVELWGGGVLVFDQFGRFRLHQRKLILDVDRQQRRLNDLFDRDIKDSRGGFGASDGVRPDARFALLHPETSEDSW